MQCWVTRCMRCMQHGVKIWVAGGPWLCQCLPARLSKLAPRAAHRQVPKCETNCEGSGCTCRWVVTSQWALPMPAMYWRSYAPRHVPPSSQRNRLLQIKHGQRLYDTQGFQPAHIRLVDPRNHFARWSLSLPRHGDGRHGHGCVTGEGGRGVMRR